VATTVVIVAIAACGITGCITAPGSVLVVEDLTRGRVLYREAIEPGSLLVLSYVHSSEHVPVRGTFIVEPDGTLRARETAFSGFGPGLPEPTAGDAWHFDNGMIVVPAAGERFPELRLRVAPLTRPRLRTASGEDIDLSARMPEGGSARIRIER
jgi:hypothetical protein